MEDSPNRFAPEWTAFPSVKTRNAIGRSVTEVLDALAPERVVKRVDQLRGDVEQYRTPTGCVLQAANCALSVSWFSGGPNDRSLGQLHIVVWRGKVTRRGAPKPPKTATIVADLILHPAPSGPDEFAWESEDGTKYDTRAVTEKVLHLLEEQIAKPMG
jgi:hypothetical protein